MFRALSLFLAVFLFNSLLPSDAAACQLHEGLWTREGLTAAELAAPCDLGDEPVELALIEHTSIEHMISYLVVWRQDLSSADCQRALTLTISTNSSAQPYIICNVEFPLDRLTDEQLLQRLKGLRPLFTSGDTDGRGILLAIKSEI